MQEADATTPARRIYFTLMLLYIYGGDQAVRERFDGFLNDFLGVTSLREVRAALKTCKWLIDVETKLLKIANDRKQGDAPAFAENQEST
jgi:flagellar biosynthesis regulator FlbT